VFYVLLDRYSASLSYSDPNVIIRLFTLNCSSFISSFVLVEEPGSLRVHDLSSTLSLL
jgi:hypothetical protein